MDYKTKIRVIPDFPEKGIRFKDITTLLQDSAAFQAAINQIKNHYSDTRVDLVVGPEARGFAIGAPLAYVLGAGFVPVRKPGKLPAPVYRHEYSLEYGKDALEIHQDAILPGQRVIIVDDLLATGGTMKAAAQLVEKLGGKIVGVAVVIELAYLNGRELLKDYPVFSLVQY